MRPALDYDVIILGAGTMGAAAAYALMSAPAPHVRVLALDRFGPPHCYGSHHGEVRMFRMSYYEHPAYVPWLRRSLTGWRALGCAWGRPLLHVTGALYMGAPDGELMAGSLRAVREHGLAHEVLSHGQLKRRYPQFEVPAEYVGLLDHGAGYIRCERAVEAMLALCGRSWRAGSSFELKKDEPAEAWRAVGDGVEVTTKRGVYSARKLVITAGAWASELLKDVGVELTVTRQVQGWFTTGAAQLEKGPCWAIDQGDGSLFYGFPAIQGPAGVPRVKCARHARGPAVNAAEVDRTIGPSDLEGLTSHAARYVPSLAGGELAASVCLYTNSPDSHWLIDRHPRHANVVFAAGFSGHGFKAAPVVGQMLRQLAMGGDHPEPFFSLERLGRAREEDRGS